ncbi:hypothetical protein LY76DRAFT_136713 [Colletotrichum caudatum]|nr:hypothetical protein LY76DRAFT_136713 [Colletotrichum caudatum]
MRFTSIIVTGALAILASAQSTTLATSTSTAASAASSEQAAIANCLKACSATDVGCQSKCISVPNPNESQVNQTTACVAACPQGDGSAEQTQKYADCSQKCINQYFYSSGGSPAATGGSGSGSGSGSGATAATAIGSGAAATGSASRTAGATGASGTEAAASASSSPNAAPALIGSASLGVVGIIGALLL